MQSDQFRISELAATYGVSLRTLRFYEQQGLLHPARIGARRIYSGRDRVALELILKGRRLGFTLAEIQRLIGTSTSPPAPDDITLRLDRQAIQRQLEHLERRRDEVVAAIAELRRGLDASTSATRRNTVDT